MVAQETDPAPVPAPVQIQEATHSTTVGVVASLTPNSVVLRTQAGQYVLFTLERDSIKPKELALGQRVRVISSIGYDGLPVARQVTILPAEVAATAPGTAAQSASGDDVPQSVRSLEKQVNKTAKKYHMGFEGGVGLDPELIVVGVNAKFGPIFSKNLFFRPDVDFAWGEVTRAFQIDLNGIYRLPLKGTRGVWGVYAGAGPNFSFVEESFSRAENGNNSVDFSDFTFKAGLNLIGGLQNRNGVFCEMRVGVYTTPTVRLMIGYQF